MSRGYDCSKDEATLAIRWPDGITYWKTGMALALNTRAAFRDPQYPAEDRKEFFAWIKLRIRPVQNGNIIWDPRGD